MSDSQSPATLLERAADVELGKLRAQDPARLGAAADVVGRVLRDGTLAGHMTPKTQVAIARELLESLPADGDGGDAD